MKRLVSIIIFLGLCAVSGAQILYYPVNLRLNSRDGIYARNEPVYVYADISEDSDTHLLYTVKVNGTVKEQKTVCLTPGVHSVFSGKYDRATSVIVSLGPVDGKSMTSVGFLVAPEEFRPGFQRPADMTEFWKKQIDAVRRMPLTFETRPATDLKIEDEEKFVCYHVEIPMPEGNPVRAYVAYPKNAAPHSLPAYIFAHSAGVNRVANKSTSSVAITRARMGCICIDVNAHGYLNDQPQSYYDEQLRGPLNQYHARPVWNHETYYFRLMYLRLIRALDYIVTLPQWDGKRILVNGDSQGGGQSLALAGLDSRITHACAIVPALTDMGGCLDGRKCGWPSDANFLAVTKQAGKKVLPYYDAALLLADFKGKLYIEAGNVDLTCDPACVSAGYNNAGTNDKEIHFSPYRAHQVVDPQYIKQWSRDVQFYRDRFFKDFLGE